MIDIPAHSAELVGSFVRKRRKANNLTQKQLGELAGVGTRFISELERGKPSLQFNKASQVLNVFGQMLVNVEAPRE